MLAVNSSTGYGGVSGERWLCQEGSRVMDHLSYLCTIVTMLLSALQLSSPSHHGPQHSSNPVSRIPLEELDPAFWVSKAEDDLRIALNSAPNTKVARSIILFVGDGMGVSTVTAGRIFKGQQDNKPGEETVLEFEKFPHVAFSKTYNVDHQVADSAATATAFLCGVKANYGTLGVDARAQRGKCASSRQRNLTCIADLAQRAGKATGLVTTARVTHATPAPLYAHTPERMWETDSLMPDDGRREGCSDIASQLMGDVGSNLNVVMGGGRKHLMPRDLHDPEYPDHTGSRSDNRDIIREWVDEKRSRGKIAQYAWDKRTFDRVDAEHTDYLLGLFEPSHMKYDVDRRRQRADDAEPSLSDMVEKAIKVLKKNDNGFFLLVEGARIDHAHHENTAKRALEEVVAFEAAVSTALGLVDTEETLLIVTADHSHPLSIASYARRGNPILGLTDFNEISYSRLSDVDNLPYTTLSYATGPGYQEGPRLDLTNVNTQSRQYRQATTVPTGIVTHEGSDVPIYAIGPMAHLFHSTHEQNYIFHVMTYAGCLDAYRRHCQPPPPPHIYRSHPDIILKQPHQSKTDSHDDAMIAIQAKSTWNPTAPSSGQPLISSYLVITLFALLA